LIANSSALRGSGIMAATAEWARGNCSAACLQGHLVTVANRLDPVHLNGDLGRRCFVVPGVAAGEKKGVPGVPLYRLQKYFRGIAGRRVTAFEPARQKYEDRSWRRGKRRVNPWCGYGGGNSSRRRTRLRRQSGVSARTSKQWHRCKAASEDRAERFSHRSLSSENRSGDPKIVPDLGNSWLISGEDGASPHMPRSASRGSTALLNSVRLATVSSWLNSPPWPIIRRCPKPPTWS
jgi:hypothetical protein